VGIILILMGAPGAGKGTQAQLISERYGWPQISTGDILREMAQSETEIGRRIRETQKAGHLVSDDIVGLIIRQRTAEDDCRHGYILDGYPRTEAQARLLEEILREQGKELVVVHIVIRRESLVKRLSGRRTCPRCHEIYNLYLKPPREDELCDRCRIGLLQRADDVPEAVAERYDVYEQKTAPLLEYYRQRGGVYEVDGERSIGDVFQEIVAIVEGHRARARRMRGEDNNRS
jgi:adenylate kinase